MLNYTRVVHWWFTLKETGNNVKRFNYLQMINTTKPHIHIYLLENKITNGNMTFSNIQLQTEWTFSSEKINFSQYGNQKMFFIAQLTLKNLSPSESVLSLWRDVVICSPIFFLDAILTLPARRLAVVPHLIIFHFFFICNIQFLLYVNSVAWTPLK